MSDVYIVSGCRTPIGSFLGQFENYPSPELGSIVIAEALKRAFLKPEDVDEVIMGNVLTSGLGQNPARQSSISAKIPTSVPAFTINMLCGSGLKSVELGYQSIRNGDANIIVAGGQENMTRAQHSAYTRNKKLGSVTYEDTLLCDGLTDVFENIHMGETAEHLVRVHNISREAQDNFALESQRRAQVAIEKDHFEKEIVPVANKKTKALIEKDEYPRANLTFQSLSALKAVFDKNGSVTPGNASGINDGAAAVVLCNQSELTRRKLTPLVRIVAIANVGLEPVNMGLGPIEAVTKVLNKAGWSKDEVDLFEVNEAFAVQSIVVINSLQLDPSKVNVSGGAIALGHPIGASGTRILVTLLHNMLRLGKKKGIATLCIGGGMGNAIAIETCL